MRSFLSRAAAMAAVLVVAAPAVAGAAVDEWAAEASTSTVGIAVFEQAVGSPLLNLVSTDALAASDPVASATVGILEVLGTQAFAPAEATSEGAPVRDPAEGDGCVLPLAASGLTLDAVCAVASADAGASDEATANATTDLLDVGVNGSFVSALLTEPLDALLNDLTAEIADGAVADAVTMFTAECDALLAELNQGGVETVPNTVADLIGMLPEETDPLTNEAEDVIRDVGGPNACSAIISLTLEDVVAPVIDVQPIADALAGVDLVQLSVEGASSDVTGEDAALTSTGEQAVVTLTGPGLDFLDDLIIGLLEGIQGGLVASIEEITGQELPAELDITDDVAGVLDMIPLFGITDPLLEATVYGGRATATLDNADATTTSGGEAPYVDLAIAPGVLELLGQDPGSGTMRFEAGQSQVIAEGTPLESTVSVGALSTQDDVTFGDTDLTGSTASTSATTVSLFNVEGAGSIEIALAASDAGVYGAFAPVAAPPVDPLPLPNTGGGAAAAAALALGAAFLLLRRRD